MSDLSKYHLIIGVFSLTIVVAILLATPSQIFPNQFLDEERTDEIELSDTRKMILSEWGWVILFALVSVPLGLITYPVLRKWRKGELDG